MMTLLNMQPSPQPDRPALKLAERTEYWMPPQASTVAEELDWLFFLIYWVSLFSFFAVVGAMIYLIWKYKATSRAANEQPEPSTDHNTTLEITWSVIPLIAVIGIFVIGFKGFVNMRTPPKDAYEIHAIGQKWSWAFKYSNGQVSDEFHVPVDTNVRVLISSKDVLHAFWVPAFRVKQDAVPGRYTDVWFNANTAGEYVLECAEYCGTSHSDMLAKVVVHEPGGFDKWMDEKIKLEEAMPPAELGELEYGRQGCKVCHSIDGTRLTGPSFKGLFGKQETLVGGGTVTVDENYIRESINEPQAKVVAGYPPSMPTYKGQLSDKRIMGIVEYIKTLK